MVKIIAFDCEFVGGTHVEDLLGRVVIINKNFQVIYDEYVKQKPDEVMNYRTPITGLTEESLKSGKCIEKIRYEVQQIFISADIIVGHSIHNDLDILGLYPRNYKIRDTQTYPFFRKVTGLVAPSLSHVTQKILGVNLKVLRNYRGGVHCPEEDCQYTLKLYLNVQWYWEEMVRQGQYRYDPDAAKALLEQYFKLHGKRAGK